MGKGLIIAWFIGLSYFSTTSANAAAKDRISWRTGKLALSEDQFRQLVDGEFNSLEVTKTAAHQYSAVSLITDVGIPQPLVNCWKLYNQFMVADLAAFQTWANKYYRPYLGCWCCPNGGLCVAFFVSPTRLYAASANPTYSAKIAVFEP